MMDKRIGDLRERLYKKKAEASDKELACNCSATCRLVHQIYNIISSCIVNHYLMVFKETLELVKPILSSKDFEAKCLTSQSHSMEFVNINAAYF